MSDKIRYIVVAGSIMSGLGKGILTSSIAKLLQTRGYNVVPIKFDGYLNVDCGTMNPFRHGEVFVLDDGTEVDMDFGTYERFLNTSLNAGSSITGGKLFQKIIEKERRGDYLGKDVQFVPHLTDEIKNWIRNTGKKNNADVVIIEVGGTVGDLENGYFLEAMRQLRFEEKHVMLVQLSYLPALSQGEIKTKPTQHATRLLQSLGLQPDVIVCRSNTPLTEEGRKKISLYCNVRENAVFDDPLLKTVYELPLVLEKQGIYNILADGLELDKRKKSRIELWKSFVDRVNMPKKPPLKIGIVGKYTAVKDAYVSVKEALAHSAAAINHGLEIEWIESADLEVRRTSRDCERSSQDFEKESPPQKLKHLHGLLVPGGFGTRGIEGKIAAIKYARENGVPYIGLCLGMQLMVVEWARHMLGLKDANSTEFDKKTSAPIVDMLPEQLQINKLGGTMRLGSYECILKEGTIAHKSYNSSKCFERHRHRFEVNPSFVEKLAVSGLVLSGTHSKNNIVEIVEWPEKYGFGVATQAHIELKSRLEAPAPIFVEFMKAAKTRADQ